MTPNNLLLNLKSKNSYDISNTSSKMPISEVFMERKGLYLNEFALFVAHYNTIPNFIHEININCKKAYNWFSGNFKSEIKNSLYTKRYYNQKIKLEIDEIYYFLYDDLIVQFDTNLSIVRFLYRNTDISIVEEIVKGIHKFKKKITNKTPEISLLVNGKFFIETKSLQITKPKLNIEDNYNEDFKEIHKTIYKRLLRKNEKGIVLLHGKPGTGKTSYIRYLITLVKKKVIFLPPNMVNDITNSGLISILVDNSNSIFVIEDAENIVVDRENNDNSPVSTLLNISDGLLSDCLNIQIICSFNTDISKIDSALLRKGRLIAKYDFKELQASKAQALSNKLRFDTIINTPMTLSDIYNQSDLCFKESFKKSIGF